MTNDTRPTIRSRGARLAACLLSCVAVSAVQAQSAERGSTVRIDDDGAVHVPAHVVPLSIFLSPEGRAYVRDHLKPDPALLTGGGPESGVPPLIAGYLARQKQVFQVERSEIKVGGVHAYDYRPHAGIASANRERVLINLHGGGFMGCWPGCAELESIPVAAMGRIRVVSLDYREGPEHRHPAASEDVAAAYRELLKSYRPENIGIYGCSAGGMLTGMSVAWFQTHGLPRPGAVGVLCAGMTLAENGFGGDSAYTTAATGEGRAPPSPPQGAASERAALPYFAGVSINDPMAAPASSREVLAKFPPTLIVTGTRGFELSSAVYTHSLLVRAGVETDLHVWEGMFHGFFYNIDVPESKDCYDVIVKFFERHLGKR